jgi:hypothetical protein
MVAAPMVTAPVAMQAFQYTSSFSAEVGPDGTGVARRRINDNGRESEERYVIARGQLLRM